MLGAKWGRKLPKNANEKGACIIYDLLNSHTMLGLYSWQR
jgi:hypothetical protein